MIDEPSSPRLNLWFAAAIVSLLIALGAHYDDFGQVGCKFLPVTKLQWGTVTEVGQCPRSRCAASILADDGRLFTTSEAGPLIKGQRVPLVEYIKKDNPNHVYFTLELPRKGPHSVER